MLQFEKGARLVLVFALAYFASSIVNWTQVITGTAAALTLGLAAFVVYLGFSEANQGKKQGKSSRTPIKIPQNSETPH